MANPQPHEFTKISNELLEALCKIRIPGEAMQCFLVILRKTYGFQKKKESISLGFFEESTGMPRPTCVRALKKLKELNLIEVDKTKYITDYAINKDYDSWQVLSKKITVKGVDKNDNSSLSKMITPIDNNDNKTVDNNDTYKRNKETFKETIKEREIAFANKLLPYLNEYGKETLNSFFIYWTEKNINDKKMRFEKQSIFELSKRLVTWKRNENKWGNKSNGRTKSTDEGIAAIARKYFADEIPR